MIRILQGTLICRNENKIMTIFLSQGKICVTINVK